MPTAYGQMIVISMATGITSGNTEPPSSWVDIKPRGITFTRKLLILTKGGGDDTLDWKQTAASNFTHADAADQSDSATVPAAQFYTPSSWVENEYQVGNYRWLEYTGSKKYLKLDMAPVSDHTGFTTAWSLIVVLLDPTTEPANSITTESPYRTQISALDWIVNSVYD
jgi:hypothetical protein